MERDVDLLLLVSGNMASQKPHNECGDATGDGQGDYPSQDDVDKEAPVDIFASSKTTYTHHGANFAVSC